MQKWEYLSLGVFTRVKDAKMNELGEQGWELVAVIMDGMGMTAYFKRPKN